MRFIAFVLLAAAAATSPAPAAEEKGAKPVPVTRVAPDYPPGADQAGILGMVRARMAVDEAGKVTAVEIVEEAPGGFGFGEAATAALRQWVFQPGRPGRMFVKLNFEPPPGGTARSVDELPKAPNPIRRVYPRYPLAAEQYGSSGVVQIVVLIGASGAVEDAWVADELPLDRGFGEAALRAVRQWEFEPGIPGSYGVQVRFLMEDATGINWYDLPIAPEPTQRVEPVPPPKAIADDRTGRLKVAFAIDEGGRVAAVKIVDESPEDYGFGDAARAALEQWRFEGTPKGVYRMKLTIAPP